MAEILVVGSKVKAFLKGKGVATSGEAIPALSKKVEEILTAAVDRTKGNRRSTVKAQDL